MMIEFKHLMLALIPLSLEGLPVSRTRSVEGLAQSIYVQACTQIQHPMMMANELQQSSSRKESRVQSLQDEVTMVKTQLKDQFDLNQHQASEFSRVSHENSVGPCLVTRILQSRGL